MKWIKSRASFLSEAKVEDVLLDPQKKEIRNTWGQQFLDLETVEATPNIEQGKWKLTQEEKVQALSLFFSADLNKVYDFFASLPEQFTKVVEESIDLSLLKEEKWSKILNEFDLKRPTVNQIGAISEPIFRKISIGESKADEIIIRDENGRPVMGEDGRPSKRKREEGEVLFSKNLVNINSFVEDYNNLFPDQKVDAFKFSSGDVMKVIGAVKTDFGGDGYLVEVDLYARDLFLRIDHNPKDIANMSISSFYASCQHLYKGGYRDQLIGNIFDPNSIPAFLVFDSPILDRGGVLISEQTPLSRMIVRNIISFDTTEESKIFFDRAYPDRMKNFFDEIVEKYTKNKQTAREGSIYLFTPDLPEEFDIRTPYMDRLSLEKGRFIGTNSKSVSFSGGSDWSRFIISPKAKIEEINIETTELPENFFDIKFNPKWIRFRYLKINDFSFFGNINSESWAFEKCTFSSSAIGAFISAHNSAKALQFINCKITGFDLSSFKNLQELELLWLNDFDFTDLQQLVQSINPKRGFKLTITSEFTNSKQEKEFINGLKGRGIIVNVLEEQLAKKRREQFRKR